MSSLKWLVYILFFASGFIPTIFVHAQTPVGAVSVQELFTQDLKAGSNGIDVQRLQKYLNTHGFSVAESGEGSLGQETQFFGAKTRAAVMRLQQQFSQQILAPLGLVYPTGNFFSATRTFVNNSLLAENQTAIVPAPVVEQATTTATTTRRTWGGRGSSKSYAVLSSAGSNVTVASVDPRISSSGETESYTVTAPTGYTINVGGTCPAGTWNGSVYTTGAINSSCTVDFSATPNAYTVTLSDTGITPNGARTVLHGSQQSFTVEAGLGYGLGTVSGTCPLGTWVHSTYTTGTITSNCSVVFLDTMIGSSVGATIMGDGTVYLRQNGTELEYSSDGTTWTTTMFPTIVNIGSETLVVQLVGDFVISSANAYIIIGSDNIEIRGDNGETTQPTIVTVHTVSNYPGFIQNGSAPASAYSDISVSNIVINSNASTLADNAGWLGQRYFGSGADGNQVSSCGSGGTLPTGSGDISAHGGGIIGSDAEDITITNCYSTGNIGSNAGGIVGSSGAGVLVERSYSTGNIGTNGGGLIGASTLFPFVTNSYSLGSIGSDAGGLIGALPSSLSVSLSYVAGNGAALNAFYGSGGSGSVSSSVSEISLGGNGWNTSNASTVLSGIGTSWISTGVNIPFKIGVFDASPYADSTQTINAGGSSTGVFGYYSGCSIVSKSGGSSDSYSNITINQDTGAVSTTADVEAGTYTLKVHCAGALGTYTTADLILEVN